MEERIGAETGVLGGGGSVAGQDGSTPARFTSTGLPASVYLPLGVSAFLGCLLLLSSCCDCR